MRRTTPTRLAAIGAASALALTACGIGGGTSEEENGGDAGSENGGDGGSENGGDADAEISGEISFMTWNLRGGYEEYFTDLVAEFEEEYPDVTVEWLDHPPEGFQDTLSADAAAGNLPDVINVGPELAYSLAAAGMLMDISETDPEAAETYLPEAWEGMTFEGAGGGTYGYPWYLNTGPSFFNTELFEECGLDPENLPETYDELFEQGSTMGENCDGVSMIGRLPTIEMMGMYGVELMNEDATEFTFNNDEGVELVQHFIDLYSDAGLTAEALNALQTGELDAFKAGEVGWLPGSSYTLQELRDTAPDIYEAAAMGPLINNTSPNMYIQAIVVNADTPNAEASMAFSRFLTNAENQMEFAQAANVFPSIAELLDDPHFTEDDGTDNGAVRVEAADQLREAVAWWPPAFSGGADVEYLREQIAQAIQGQKTAQEALDDAVAYSNNRLSNQ